MVRAVQDLGIEPEWVLLDGPRFDSFPYRQIALTAGDRLVPSIAAASVVAKVVRDALMRHYDAVYPGYGFAAHKGYPTPAHLRALAALGPCPIHRRSFRPVAQLLLPLDDAT